MSLKTIIDSFQQGRRDSKEIFNDESNDDYKPVECPRMEDLVDADLTAQPNQNQVPLYSPAERTSYVVGFLSHPKAAYEIAKFFISGQYLGGQGISQEEIEEDLKDQNRDDPNTYKP